MAESSVQVTEGSGKRLHTFDRSIAGNTVHDEVIVQGEPYLATYYGQPTVVSTLGTANAHVVQIMAGASKPVYIKRIVAYLTVAASAQVQCVIQLMRVSTAGTGGTAGNINPLDSTDGAAGATIRHNLTASKGTEGVVLDEADVLVPSALQPTVPRFYLFDFDYRASTLMKSPRIPAGATNGIVVKWLSAATNAETRVLVHLVEANV